MAERYQRRLHLFRNTHTYTHTFFKLPSGLAQSVRKKIKNRNFTYSPVKSRGGGGV